MGNYRNRHKKGIENLENFFMRSGEKRFADTKTIINISYIVYYLIWDGFFLEIKIEIAKIAKF